MPTTTTDEAPTAPKWLSPQDVASIADCHYRTVIDALVTYKQTNGKRGLRGSQPGGPKGRWKIRPAAVDDWIDG